jgi:hypothetical protein
MADRIDHTPHTWHENTPAARRRCRDQLAKLYLDSDMVHAADSDARTAWWQRHEASKRRSVRVAQQVEETLQKARDAGLLGPWRIGGPVTVRMSDADPQRGVIVLNSNPNYITVMMDRSGRTVTLLRYDVTPIEDEPTPAPAVKAKPVRMSHKKCNHPETAWAARICRAEREFRLS